MHRLAVLYLPPEDPDHFRDYYVRTHLPLAAKIPGQLGYRYSFEVSPAPGSPPYFAVFEADFPDGDTLRAGLASPEGTATLADVPNYATGGMVSYTYPLTEGG